jgi:Cu(I)/Ag(I) efflux system membrane fusion protein
MPDLHDQDGAHVKSIVKVTAIVALVAIALIAGFWLGKTGTTPFAGPSSEVSSPERKVLYYRNPMGLPDISAVPKKDPMGMDYIPVYAGEEQLASNSAVRISPEKIQKLGVKTEAVALRRLARTVRAVSTVQPDERSLYTVAPKFEGWIQRLYVNTTGQTVKRGDPLMDVYSPELVTAQHEYLIAKKGTEQVGNGGLDAIAGMQRLGESALQRLRNWDISESDLEAVQEEGRVSQNLTLRSPARGVVLEKKVIQGQRFMPGEILYQIADLSNVWMLADVFEQDLALVRKGQTATIRIDAYPGKLFNGKVTYIYPTVDPATRTAKVRIELPNAQALLKPDMYGRVEIVSSASAEKVLAVPDPAVLHTGTREVVLVDLGEGRYEPRTVKLGPHADGYAEVLGGLKEGERVVVKANFLIDAESNLKAALSAFGERVHGAHGSTPGEDRRASAGSLGAARPQAHHGEGIIEAIDFAHATVTLAHGPIASLTWPAMVMDFRVRDPAWLRTLKPGQKIGFEIIEESAGEYVIARIEATGEQAKVPASASNGQGSLR